MHFQGKQAGHNAGRNLIWTLKTGRVRTNMDNYSESELAACLHSIIADYLPIGWFKLTYIGVSTYIFVCTVKPAMESEYVIIFSTAPGLDLDHFGLDLRTRTISGYVQV